MEKTRSDPRRENLQERQTLDGDDLPEPAAEGGPGQKPNQRHLQQIHDQLQTALAEAEHFAPPAERVERGKIDGEALRAEIKSNLRDVGDDHDEDGPAENRGQREETWRGYGRPARRPSGHVRSDM